MSQEITQNRINEIQEKYREWKELHQKLTESLKYWQKSAELMKDLEKFYFSGEYQNIYEQIENGAEFDLKTKGEYSIMSEDTLWNAFHEQQSLLWKQLRFAVEQLDTNEEKR